MRRQTKPEKQNQSILIVLFVALAVVIALLRMLVFIARNGHPHY
ncbi:MAG TPA: hypothetical protein VL991_07985 [Terracidiphilus sp.]|jgi:hypothetical protein|nr:hypothetical protein [Terracidiphilus sp.]